MEQNERIGVDGYQWPEIFINPEKCAPPNEHARELAIAHASLGWGLCCAGAEMPEKFGEGMIKLAEWAGVKVLTPDVTKKLAEAYLADNN